MSAPQKPGFSGVRDEPQKLAIGEYLSVREWRHTRMGGLTKSIAICQRCGYITPYYMRVSRRGTHGEEYYRHQHPITFLVLYQSNSGKRNYDIEGYIPEPTLADKLRKIGEAWSLRLMNIANIIDLLQGG